ncbi:hypothetical protein HDA40_007726 [Hamadaea flava]|uniref:Uncharacterized protein n=1 Tax=Hamadaea flava TaxID=1742688 RepID=A0ABV8LWN8_9ACTN|nr:hypothetical protein [Hamadaea flava]MCP2329219.1 hypothetical protein [Hamadaea flava]
MASVRLFQAVAVGIALAAGACSPGSTTAGSRPDSTLAAALDVVPELADANALFTDWDALGHKDSGAFAAALLRDDDALRRDLGIRSIDADWELDLWQPGTATTAILHYAEADLAALPGKLTGLGYHADGAVYTGTMDQRHMWTIPARTIGVDLDRRLLVAGPDATTVRSVLAAPPHPLGRLDALKPLLSAVAARPVLTAAMSVGSAACRKLDRLVSKGRATPEQMQAVRGLFSGPFTAPQAQLIAVTSATTAYAGMTFADERAAAANREGRAAAVRTVGGLAGDPDGIQVTGSSVSGRVLGFDLKAQDSQTFRKRVTAGTLGVDVCL